MYKFGAGKSERQEMIRKLKTQTEKVYGVDVETTTLKDFLIWVKKPQKNPSIIMWFGCRIYGAGE